MANKDQIERGKAARSEIARLLQKNHALTLTEFQAVFERNGLSRASARNILFSLNPRSGRFASEYGVPTTSIQHRGVEIWLRSDVDQDSTDLGTIRAMVDQTLDTGDASKRTHRRNLRRLRWHTRAQV